MKPTLQVDYCHLLDNAPTWREDTNRPFTLVATGSVKTSTSSGASFIVPLDTVKLPLLGNFGLTF